MNDQRGPHIDPDLRPLREHVPDSVLDELKLAFSVGDAPDEADPVDDPFADPDVTRLPDAVVDDEAIALALAAAGDPELDVEPGPAPATVIGAAPADPSPATPPPASAPSSPSSSPGATTVPRTTIVIGGADDDLPDPVYLDEEEPIVTRTGPDDSGGRSTIVIGDELDSSGAFDAVAVPARSMDPRVRARRIAVKRAAGRRRLVWVGAIGGAVLVVVGVLAVFSSSLFAVETVDVQGDTYTAARNNDQLQAVIEELRGEPVLLVDTRRAERELELIPWVERAFVTTDFPSRVLIDIRERLPLATYQGSDERYRVIDRDGRVLDVLDGRPADYMLVSGTGPDLEPGALAGTPFAQVAQLVGALPAELRDRTVSASVDATTGDLGLVIQGDPPAEGAATTAPVPDVEVRLGNATGLDAKLARLVQQLRDGIDGVGRLDVSTDEVIRSPL